MSLYRLYNKVFLKSVLSFFFLLLTISSIAQVIITNPSTTVKIIDKKKYYIHHVLQGQTLSSLARTYGVKVMDIVAENPGSENGLKLDQDLRIPYVEGFIPGDPLLRSGNQTNISDKNTLPKQNNEPVVTINPSTIVKVINNKKFYIHHVLQGQTLTSLARTYGVKVMDIVAENPGSEEGLKLWQDLRIPYMEGFIPGDPVLKSGNQVSASDKNPLPKKNNESVVNRVSVGAEKPSSQLEKENKNEPKKTEPEVSVNKKKNEKEEKAFTGKEAEGTKSNLKKEELEKKIDNKENVPNASLGNHLAENKQEQISTSYEEVTEKINLLDTLAFQNFCNNKITTYFNDTASLNHFWLKEYFYFTIGKEGQIDSVKGEQTEFNKNTRLLTQNDQGNLKKLKFKPAKKNNDFVVTRVPVGIQLDVQRDSLEIKISGEKIRVFNRPLFVEYIEPENPYYSLIMDKAKNTEKTNGSYFVIILNGEYALYDMGAKEYNPFGQKISDLYKKKVLTISEFKKQ